MIQGRLVLKIYGQVQGVGFRWSAREKAKALGLTGWIKNCPNGTVEAIAEGLDTDLKEFITWCYNGNNIAKVKKIEKKWEESREEFDKFEIH